MNTAQGMAIADIQAAIQYIYWILNIFLTFPLSFFKDKVSKYLIFMVGLMSFKRHAFKGLESQGLSVIKAT